MITERVYVRSQSLAEIHQQIAQMEAAGWQKSTGLMYTHDESGQGWEMGMHRPVDADGPPPRPFVEFFDGFVRGVLVVVVAAAGVLAVLSVVRWIW